MSDWLSSSAVPILPAAAELLTDLSIVLSRWGGWYLFGAQAVIAHGVPRLSADVDVTLWRVRGRDVDPERIRRILRLLEEALSQSDLVPAFEAIVMRVDTSGR